MNDKRIHIKTLNGAGSINRYTALWRAVLHQALTDTYSNSTRSMEILAKEKAKNFINVENPNFKRCCDFAGYRPEYFYKKALDFLKIKNIK